MTENKVYKIYKATSPSGKIYIGQTSVRLKDRKNAHNSQSRKKNPETIFHNALKKYNQMFTWEVIEEAGSREEINFLEKYYIKFYNSTNRNFGYNQDLGGLGGNISLKENRVKQKEATEKFWRDPNNKLIWSARFFKNKEKIQTARKVQANTPEGKILASKNAGGKPFMCIETGEIFQTQVEASGRFNCAKNTINRILTGKYKKLFKKYTFKYVVQGDDK